MTTGSPQITADMALAAANIGRNRPAFDAGKRQRRIGRMEGLRRNRKATTEV